MTCFGGIESIIGKQLVYPGHGLVELLLGGVEDVPGRRRVDQGRKTRCCGAASSTHGSSLADVSMTVSIAFDRRELRCQFSCEAFQCRLTYKTKADDD